MNEIFTSEFRFPFPDDARDTPEELKKSFAIGGTKFEVFKTHSPQFKGKMIVEGESSNADRDMDGETVLTKGMELDYARQQGKILWGHTPKDRPIDPGCVIL